MARALNSTNPQAKAVYQRLKEEAAGLRATIIAAHWALTPLISLSQQLQIIPRCAHVHVLWYQLRRPCLRPEGSWPAPSLFCDIDAARVTKCLAPLLPAMAELPAIQLISLSAFVKRHSNATLPPRAQAFCEQVLQALTSLQV